VRGVPGLRLNVTGLFQQEAVSVDGEYAGRR
jgi:hypothetical protein